MPKIPQLEVAETITQQTVKSMLTKFRNAFFLAQVYPRARSDQNGNNNMSCSKHQGKRKTSPTFQHDNLNHPKTDQCYLWECQVSCPKA